MKLSTLSLIFLALIGLLLIGQSLEFPFAGIEPIAQSPVQIRLVEGSAQIDRNGTLRKAIMGEALARGEILLVEEGARALLEIEGSLIGLDERTDLRIDRLDTEDLVLHLRRGRLMATASHPMAITTNFTETALLKGAVSIINFDFRERVSINPIETTVAVLVEPDKSFLTDSPVEIKETPPTDITDTAFSPFEGAGADFYRWFGEVTDFSFTPPTLMSHLDE